MLLALLGCGVLPLDPTPELAWVVYDPSGGEVPTPNDLVRDADGAHLALPIEDDQSPAEQAFRAAMNEQDGWSSASAVSFVASAPLDPASVTADSVAVWEWGLEPALVGDLVRTVADDGLSVEIAAPPTGWAAGGRYVVVVGGLRTADGVAVGADAAFHYLRSPEPLTGHDRAFPGATRAERLAAADRLEPVRAGLAPVFDALGLDRAQVSALWDFTVTRRPELAMDAASHRMPLPFDLLTDPATGLVDLPPDADDDELELDAKAVASTMRGFAISANLLFESTLPLDPATVSDATVELWRLGQTPERVPAAARAWREEGPCEPGDDGCVHVVVDPEPLPLDPGATYAVVVREGITDRAGEALLPMPIGHLLRLDDAVAADGSSAIASVPDEDAVRVEGVRADVDTLLDSLGRDGIVTAWTFGTLDTLADLRAVVGIPEAMAYVAEPTVLDRGPADRWFGEDPLSDLFPGLLNPADVVYLPRVDGVAEVIEGTIPSPVHLDPVTRRWTEPPVMRDLHFVATIPAGVPRDEPVPVVIFGHAVVTDRRFLLTVAGELAKEGFAAVSVDFPYHGERIACVDASLVSVPNFFPPSLQPLVGFTEPLISARPCVSGASATCSPDGRCLGPDGQPEPFNSLPIVDIRPAAGAAFLDVDDLPHIPDHFRQALVDLGALRYSLQTADWEAALGRPIRTDRFVYAGQSLGGIIGAVYVAADPTIARAVFNVPGADMVDLFSYSTFFGPQMDAYLDEIEVEKGSFEHERLLDVAHWLIDAVDPHTVGHVYRDEADRVAALIQMDRINDELGDLVIPNATTDVLAEVSGLPVLEYPSVLHGDLVIPLIGDAQLRDLADFLADGP